MVVETLFNVGEEVIANINYVSYNAIIEAININIRNIDNINVITNRYGICYEISINNSSNRIERTIVTEDKLTKIK